MSDEISKIVIGCLKTSFSSTDPPEVTGTKFSSFCPSEETWESYSSRFANFCKARCIRDHQVSLVYLTIQTKEIYTMIKVVASQLSTPKEPDSLSFHEIGEIMKENFDAKNFIIRER
ncbi:hypothetical protein RF11_05410 [Thelohanellus kitauei]|uniref:Uncharacterized protein n=1 Tax=Thelohanellus kitauei TaxID=669202 RepID=A0A0C2IZS2_THEKT|nr:hypothetical protein RF11_05410 [Thelohanellus kitauei]